MAVDESGDVVGEAASSYPLLTPRPQWTEQSPEEWWRGTRQALAEVCSQLRSRHIPIVGLGLTGQMHGSVFLNRSGGVIRPALLWNDQRTARQCQEITRRVGPERLVEITGNPALTGFQAPKVLWVREEEPEHYRRIERVLLPRTTSATG